MNPWIPIFISLLFSAFFSAIEIAFISADRLQLALKQNEGGRTAKLLYRFYKLEDYFICTTLTGNTISLVLYGIFMAQVLDPPLKTLFTKWLINNDALIETAVLGSQTILSTMLVLAVAEFLPKSIALASPNRIIEVLVHFMRAVYFVFYPFVWVIIKSAKWFTRKVFKIEEDRELPLLGISDLNHYIQKLSGSQGEKSNVDADLFQNAVEFRTLKVRDCMIPRTDIVSISIDESIEKLQQLFVESGHSKIIIYRETIDNVIGYSHALRLFDHPTTIKSVTDSIFFVPETMHTNELMMRFIATRKSMALVTDEFGGTAGIVTIEDIVEEILGEIEDEHDEEGLFFEKIDEKNFLLHARYDIQELNEKHNWNIPEGEYDTLGGYILEKLGTMPEAGTQIKDENFTILVKEMQGARIEIIAIRFYETPYSEEEEDMN